MGTQNTHKCSVASLQCLVAETEGAEGTAAIEFVASAQSFRLSDKWNIASVIVEATQSLVPLSELPSVLSQLQLRHQVNHLAGCLYCDSHGSVRDAPHSSSLSLGQSQSLTARPTHSRNKTIGVLSMQVASVNF